MPLVFMQGRLMHFAHVPRCGGTAVENYLHARFGPLAFLDRQFRKLDDAGRWSKTSPQHLESAVFDRIMPRTWIAHRFAVVRHPEDRIASVFRFQRDVEGTMAADQDFTGWLARLAAALAETPRLFDNHARPATDLVPADAVIFQLEDGLMQLIDWLDTLEGASRGPREIAKANDYTAVLDFLGKAPGPAPDITPDAREAIAQIYAEDFHRFGYTPRIGIETNGMAEGPT